MACSLYTCLTHLAINIYEAIWMFVTDLPSYAPVFDTDLAKKVFCSAYVYDTNSLSCTLNIHSEKISVKQKDVQVNVMLCLMMYAEITGIVNSLYTLQSCPTSNEFSVECMCGCVMYLKSDVQSKISYYCGAQLVNQIL